MPLYTPNDASFPSAAAEILQRRAEAVDEASAADASLQDMAWEEMSWQESGSEAPMLPQEQGVCMKGPRDLCQSLFPASLQAVPT